MPRKGAVEKDTSEFQEIFSRLNPNNRQYTLAIIRSLQFAEEQERRAKEGSASGEKGGGETEGGDASC